MAISFVGSASAAATSVTLPAHQAGDLIVIFAGRNNVPATVPAGYTTILSAASGTKQSVIAGYKIAASSSETSGTWTNASKVVAVVYRGVNQANPIGGSDAYNNGNARNIESGPITFTDTGGSSWVAHGVGVASVITYSSIVPTGMTYRDQQTTSPSLGVYDTNGGVSSRTAVTTDYSSGTDCAAVTFEIRADLSVVGSASIAEANDTVSATGAIALAGAASITEAADTISAASVNQKNLINDGGANASVWSYSGQSSVTGGQADPFGGSSACLFLESAGNDYHQLIVAENRRKAAVAKPYKFSAIVSGVGRDAVGLGFYDITGAYGSGVQVAFDLASGAVGFDGSYGAAITLTSAHISPVASGWWRVEILVNVGSSVLEFAPMAVPLLSSASYSSQYVGDTSKGFLATRETLIDLEWVKEGRASIQEGDDTISAAGAVSIKASAAITESADTVSAAGLVAVAASASITVAGDTIEAAAGLSIRAAAAITEADDAAEGAGALLNLGAAAIAEGDDIVSAVGGPILAAVLDRTEADDTITAVGALAIAGAVSVAEDDDTIAAAAELAIAGAASIVDAGDTISAAAGVSIRATAAIVEDGDTLAAATELERLALVDIIEVDDAVEAIGRLAISGSASMIDTDDLAATGGAISTGYLETIEADDTIEASGSSPRRAVAAITESADTISAAGVIPLFAAASIVEAGDALVAAGVVALVGQAAITEADDTISAAGMVALYGAASLVEAGDTISAAGVTSIRAAAAITEADDMAEGAGALLNLGAAAIVERDDVVIGVGRLAAKGAAVIAEGDDTIVAVGRLAIAATVAIVEQNDVSAGQVFRGLAVYYWTGSAWILKPLKIWRGGQWVAVTRVSRWNGSAWVPMAA